MAFLKTWRNLPLHIMIFPALALVLVYSYVPMVGIVIGFQSFLPGKGLFGSEWIGLENFRYLLDMPDTLQVLRNTLLIASLKIVVGEFFPIFVALLLNEVRKLWFKRGVQTLIYLPYFMSWVILGGILIDILSPSQGIVNQMLGWIGFEPVYFLGSNDWFPYTMVMSHVWKEFGFNTIVYLAILTSISPSLYEAAVIDGAGRWKQTLHVTLPGMVPIILLMTTLSLGNVLNAGFDQIFILYSPSVYDSGDIIDTLVFRTGLQNAQYGVATAVGLFKSVVSFLLISVSYIVSYRMANYRIF
ncbi:putative aldouronate transport system permease protein [Cohnella sp. OV330]|uniref:ABC transporter permease n=1 Tax=Cohnella sp. OV330 TaxID=1855288 RepID=UPI0008E3D24D|nr:ABC transporter permease subunit [Cohnella sp. OV330]SFB39106.1 putative aldouronate transport system permease protein [Cohnella sp. OV330]